MKNLEQKLFHHVLEADAMKVEDGNDTEIAASTILILSNMIFRTLQGYLIKLFIKFIKSTKSL